MEEKKENQNEPLITEGKDNKNEIEIENENEKDL